MEATKKRYEAPQLKDWGSVVDLTQSSGYCNSGSVICVSLSDS